MLVFGIVGMVIAGIIALGLIGGAVAARNLDERLAADQARLVASLERVNDTMTRLVTTTDNASATLTTTSESLATAVRRPRPGRGHVAGDRRDRSTSASSAAGRLRAPRRSSRSCPPTCARSRTMRTGCPRTSPSTRRDVRGLAAQLEVLRARTSPRSRTGSRRSARRASSSRSLVGGILLTGLLVAWLAVAAAGCAWIGLRLRRIGATVGAAVRGHRCRPGRSPALGRRRVQRRSSTRGGSPRSAGSTTRSTNRSEAWPSATSNDAARERARRAPRRSPRRARTPRAPSVVSKIGPGHARPEVDVEAALALVGVRIRGEERHRPAEQRVLEDRARVVGDEQVGDEHELVHVGPVGDVDREGREIRVDRRGPADERVEADAARPTRRRGRRASRRGRACRRSGPRASCRRGTSARRAGPCGPCGMA